MLLDKPHDGRRDDRFGQRGEQKDGVLAHRNASLTIGKSRRPPEDHFATASDEHDPADDASFHERPVDRRIETVRSEEHTSELQSLMRISYPVSFLQKKYNL